jgi:hypothetical protein
MQYTRRAVLTHATKIFPPEEIETAMTVLDTYGTAAYELERERVQLAILKLSAGQIDQLRHYTQAAKTDYRDVLYWAEYNGGQAEVK